jgi:lysophospholipase L1-like esterase
MVSRVTRKFRAKNKAILDRVRSDCAEAGVTPLFVRISYAGAHREFRTLHDYRSRTQANFIDLRDSNRLPLVGTSLPDGHLNATGHRYMADAVAAWIAANRPDL